MNYINKDERVKSKRQFILLFSLAVILTVTVASAFFTPSSVIQPKEQPIAKEPATIIKKFDTITKETLVTDTVNKKLAIALQKKLDDKNGEVMRLQLQLNRLKQTKRQNQSKPSQSFDEINFLKLALRSQTSLVDKLKKENENLKQRK